MRPEHTLLIILAPLLSVLYGSGEGKRKAQDRGYPDGIKSDKAMKKVLVLSSSPRKGGNSDMLCNRFMEGALASGHKAEKLFLYDYDIKD